MLHDISAKSRYHVYFLNSHTYITCVERSKWSIFVKKKFYFFILFVINSILLSFGLYFTVKMKAAVRWCWKFLVSFGQILFYLCLMWSIVASIFPFKVVFRPWNNMGKALVIPCKKVLHLLLHVLYLLWKKTQKNIHCMTKYKKVKLS